jgi:hypothetical protein
MPTPNKGEKQQKFVSRCISYLSKESPGMSSGHKAAKCYGIWRQHRGGKKPTKRGK